VRTFDDRRKVCERGGEGNFQTGRRPVGRIRREGQKLKPRESLPWLLAEPLHGSRKERAGGEVGKSLTV